MDASDRFAGSRIPDSGFAGDSGDAAEVVSSALADYARDPQSYAATLAVLQESRLLVPVVALLGEVEYDAAGLAHDKSSDMAAVLMTGRDGRLALLAFTGTGPLQAWNPDARPVPVTAQHAAQSAVQDDAAAIVVDIAGPTTFVIEGNDLQGLARGWTLGRLGDTVAWIRPADE